MGTLFIVSTPIGNLDDISARALGTLGKVSIIFAEDTRRTGKLLQHFGINIPLKSYHEHNVEKTIPYVISSLQDGAVALVSDSGTPLISDPGFKLVREVIGLGGKVVSVPGASALLTALVVSGLPTDKFSFRGFPPKKSGQLRKEFELVSDREETIIYYESPYRITKTLSAIKEILGEDRKVVVARELTKLHEEIFRGTVNEVLEILLHRGKIKGEIVLMIAKARF